MNIQTTKTLTECLLPSNLISVIAEKKLDLQSDKNDRSQLIVVELMTNIAVRNLTALIEGNLYLLDPNPGDFACQIRAVALVNFSKDQELMDEARQLLIIAKRLNELVLGLRRSENKKMQPEMRVEMNALLFDNRVGSILCSEKIEFVLLCGFLNALRNPYKTLANGIVMSQTETSKLRQFSKNVDAGLKKEFRDGIVEQAQVNLTFFSMNIIREVSKQLTLIDEKEKTVLDRMLSKENTLLSKLSPPFIPKALGCQFYETKAVLMSLREQQGLVAIKSIVPKGEKNFILFFRPTEIGGDFEPVSMESVQTLDPMTPIVVLQGVVGVTPKELTERIKSEGFTRMVLTDASIQNQYGTGVKAEEIKAEEIRDEEARQEILSYKKDAEALLGKGVEQLLESKETPILMLYHFFANTIKSELARMNPN